MPRLRGFSSAKARRFLLPSPAEHPREAVSPCLSMCHIATDVDQDYAFPVGRFDQLADRKSRSASHLRRADSRSDSRFVRSEQNKARLAAFQRSACMGSDGRSYLPVATFETQDRAQALRAEFPPELRRRHPMGVDYGVASARSDSLSPLLRTSVAGVVRPAPRDGDGDAARSGNDDHSRAVR